MRGSVAVVALGLLGWVGCEETPCDRYVDYICVCHADDAEFDCQELQSALAGAEAAIQDQCAIDLADQEDLDAEAELTCDPAP